MELKVGQKVAYPGQGVCLVENVQRKIIGGKELKFYSLRILSDDSIILVPMQNAENVGIRPLLSSIQCKKLIKWLSADFGLVSCDWKTRSKEFTEKLRTGCIFEAADVLKKLTFLSKEKKLSFREQTLMEKSRFLIVSELSNTEKEDDELAVNKEIDKLIAAACRKHLIVQPTVMQINAF